MGEGWGEGVRPMTMKRLTPVARKLRRSSTDAEALLWARLRNRQLLGFKFRRQVPIGGYVADLVCEQARMVVEIDGGQHAGSTIDAARTAAIEGAGYHVLRFWNSEVLSNSCGVLEAIAQTLCDASEGGTPHPTLSRRERA